MEILIISGLSGAGKSRAASFLEDMGFYIVDNMPAAMILKFAEFCAGGNGRYDRVALVYDVRTGSSPAELFDVLDQLKRMDGVCRMLFLEASPETIIKRYKETRRSHPLAGTGRLDKGIAKEREKLAFLKKDADYIIDTSKLLTRELRQELEKIFIQNEKFSNMFITVLSFGFKYGVPIEADMVFDVRFLPNPYYEEDLRHKTGLDDPVYDYVFRDGNAAEFLTKLVDMLMFLIPLYEKEGKYSLTVGIGCTGGQHRSVSIARALTEYLKQHDIPVRIEHRNIDGDTKVR